LQAEWNSDDVGVTGRCEGAPLTLRLPVTKPEHERIKAIESSVVVFCRLGIPHSNVWTAADSLIEV